VLAHGGGFVGGQGAGLVIDEGVLNALAVHGERRRVRLGRKAGG
jgi:hypothetical protein